MLLHHLLRCLSLHLTQIHLHRHHLVWTSEPATSSSACGHGMAQKEDPALGWNSHGCCDTPMPQTCCWTRSRSHPEAPISGFGLTYIGRARCSAESVRSGSWIDNVRAGWLKHIASAYPNSGPGDGALLAAGCCREHLSRPWTLRRHSRHHLSVQPYYCWHGLVVSASSSVEKPLQLVSLPGHTRLNHRTCCLDSNHLSHCTSGLGNYCFHFL